MMESLLRYTTHRKSVPYSLTLPKTVSSLLHKKEERGNQHGFHNNVSYRMPCHACCYPSRSMERHEVNDTPREVARWSRVFDVYRIVNDGTKYLLQYKHKNDDAWQVMGSNEGIEQVLCRYIEAGK